MTALDRRSYVGPYLAKRIFHTPWLEPHSYMLSNLLDSKHCSVVHYQCPSFVNLPTACRGLQAGCFLPDDTESRLYLPPISPGEMHVLGS
jgi:hypothetical protein